MSHNTVDQEVSSAISWLRLSSPDEFHTFLASSKQEVRGSAPVRGGTWTDSQLGLVTALIYDTDLVGDSLNHGQPYHLIQHGPCLTHYSLDDAQKLNEGASVFTVGGHQINFPSILTENELKSKGITKLLILPPCDAAETGGDDNQVASLEELGVSLDTSQPDFDPTNQASWDAIKSQKLHIQAISISGIDKAQLGKTQHESEFQLKGVQAVYLLTTRHWMDDDDTTADPNWGNAQSIIQSLWKAAASTGENTV